jgi:hypothetical protein
VRCRSGIGFVAQLIPPSARCVEAVRLRLMAAALSTRVAKRANESHVCHDLLHTNESTHPMIKLSKIHIQHRPSDSALL